MANIGERAACIVRTPLRWALIGRRAGRDASVVAAVGRLPVRLVAQLIVTRIPGGIRFLGRILLAVHGHGAQAQPRGGGDARSSSGQLRRDAEYRRLHAVLWRKARWLFDPLMLSLVLPDCVTGDDLHRRARELGVGPLTGDIASLRPPRVSAILAGGALGCWLRTPGVDPTQSLAANLRRPL